MVNIQPSIDPKGIPGFVLWQLSKLWQRALTNALKPFGIGSTEFVILGNAVRLSQLGQTATQSLVTETTKIDRMTASQTLRSLEKKKLIERRSFSGDKRTLHILPTEAGISLADIALGRVIEIHTKFFEPLNGRSEQFLSNMQLLIEEGERLVVTQDSQNDFDA